MDVRKYLPDNVYAIKWTDKKDPKYWGYVGPDGALVDDGLYRIRLFFDIEAAKEEMERLSFRQYCEIVTWELKL